MSERFGRSLLPVAAIAVVLIALGTVQQWEHVGTLRWWIAVAGGVVLGVAFAWAPLAALLLGVAGAVAILVGLAESVEGQNRALFSGLALGVLFAQALRLLASKWARRRH